MRDVRSLNPKRAATAAIAAAAIAAVLSVPSPAIADPSPLPDTASEALKEYRELQHKAEQLNEEKLKAEDDLGTNTKKRNKAERAEKTARKAKKRAEAQVVEYRKEVDRFASATYRGSNLSSVSAALTGQSARDFLDRSATINLLASEKAAALTKLTRAVEEAAKAEKEASSALAEAQKAKKAAQKALSKIKDREQALQDKVDEAQAVYNELSAEEEAELRENQASETEVPPSNIKAPGPTAQAAVDAAMSKRGSPYVYGANGPNSFDCSGLTSWAYSQAGVSIPRSSSAQSQSGTPVSRDQLAPGDLLFFYSPVSHVGMYIGDGLMVHAPTSGDVVKVVEPMWGNYVGARRYA